MNCNCSKPVDQMPMMNPNRLNVAAVSTRNATIQNGCRIWIGTKKDAVIRMTSPRTIDLVAAAPTYASTISRYDTGADRSS